MSNETKNILRQYLTIHKQNIFKILSDFDVSYSIISLLNTHY